MLKIIKNLSKFMLLDHRLIDSTLKYLKKTFLAIQHFIWFNKHVFNYWSCNLFVTIPYTINLRKDNCYPCGKYFRKLHSLNWISLLKYDFPPSTFYGDFKHVYNTQNYPATLVKFYQLFWKKADRRNLKLHESVTWNLFL